MIWRLTFLLLLHKLNLRNIRRLKKDPARKLRENIVTQPDGDYMKLANPLPADYIKRKEEEWKQYYKDNDNDIDKEQS